MHAEWTRTAAPAQEPLTLDEAKSHLIIHQDDDDLLIDAYLRAAREAAEQYLGIGLFTQTWKLTLQAFADVIWLPMASPLASVTSVKYYDADGTLQTLSASSYIVDTVSTPGRIVKAPTYTWPTVQSERLMPVEITYVCGWSSTDLIPELIKQGIRVYLTGLEGQRGDPALAKQAAESLWRAHGAVRWIPPQCYVG